MSLSKLLNSDEESSSWNKQKKQVIRMALICIAGITILVVLFFIFYPKIEDELRVSEIKGERVETFTQLLQLQKEAEKLDRQLETLVLHRSPRVVSDDFRRQRQERSHTPKARPRPTHYIFDYDPKEGFQQIHNQEELTYVPIGSVFQAKLITPIKTSVQRTFVLAETTVEYRIDHKRKIQKNSRLIGQAYLNPILKGVVVEFSKIVLPTGKENNIKALALSRNALPELEGLYFSDDLEKYSTALAFGFLSGFANAAQDREPTIYGATPKQSVNNQVLSGLSVASFQVAEEILRDVRQRAVEYVVVPAGKSVFVALTNRYYEEQDLSLEARKLP